MTRISIFLLGVAVGAIGHFMVLNHYVVRADDGFHVIPKITAALENSYIDIRNFDIADWTEHRPLAAAIVRAEKVNLIQNAAGSSLKTSVHKLADVLTGT